jgi:hypothetical protein
MRSELIVQKCLSYFNGFYEIPRCKNRTELLSSLLKIVSYALLLPPVIVGVFYFHHKKIAILENSFNQLMDNTEAYRAQEVFHRIHRDNSRCFKQKDIIQCLLIKISDLKCEELDTAEEIKEIERIKKGFLLLSLEKQHDLFLKLIDKGLMSKLLDMDLIPKDITELNFTLGESRFQNLEANDTLATKFLSKLTEFRSLKKIRLDLKGIGFYGPAANQNLENLSQSIHVSRIDAFLFPTINNTKITREGKSYFYSDRNFPIVNAMVQLRKFIDRANSNGSNFEYHLDFMNLLVGGNNRGGMKSWENEEAFGRRERTFTSGINSFLHHN